MSINVWTFAQDVGSVLNPVKGSAATVRSLTVKLLVIASFITSLALWNAVIVCGTSSCNPFVSNIFVVGSKYDFVADIIFLLVKSLTSVETASIIYPRSLLHLSGFGFVNVGYWIAISANDVLIISWRFAWIRL